MDTRLKISHIHLQIGHYSPQVYGEPEPWIPFKILTEFLLPLVARMFANFTAVAGLETGVGGREGLEASLITFVPGYVLFGSWKIFYCTQLDIPVNIHTSP